MTEHTAQGTATMAVSPHELASQAAVEVMAAGGSAVDGAIAANAVVGVVRPTDCGIGGDLFAIVHQPGDDMPSVLNASGRAGSGVSAEALRAGGHSQMPHRHPATVTVPGCVDGWLALNERYGRVSITQVLAPAVRLAEEGFPVSLEISWNLAETAGLVAEQGSVDELYPEGQPPLEGTVLTRPALGRALTRIGEQGRSAFYEGEIASAIVDATGGLISLDDLVGNHADWVEPLGLDLMMGHAWTVPPSSQGYVTLATLWLLERMGGSSDFEDPEFHHQMIEAYRAAVWDRDLLLGDPDNMTVATAELLEEARLYERLTRIYQADRVTPWPAPDQVPGGTAYMCTVDGDGMGVSLMQSNFAGIGSGLSAGATGVWLHNRGAGFNLEPGHPNLLAPGKRPLHTLAPTLWTRDGRLSMLLGTRGGHSQPQLVAQLAVQQLLVGMSPAEAQEAPRWALADFGPGQGSAPVFEEEMPAMVVDELVRRGHRASVTPRQRDWGPAAIIRMLDDQVRVGAADPRVSTAAVAVG